MPSAFIPFCFFGNKILGKRIDNFSLPVCTAFEPVVFDGDLCYQITLNLTVENDLENGIGNMKGLMFELDYNLERGLGAKTTTDSEEPTVNVEWNSLTRYSKGIKNNAKIHISTLESYTSYGPGSYALTSVKMMTGSRNFLALPEEKKGCQDSQTAEVQPYTL